MIRFAIRQASVAVILALVTAAPAAAAIKEAPTAAAIERYRLAEARRALKPFDAERLDPETVIRLLEARSRDVVTVSIFSQGLAVAQNAALVGRVPGEARWKRFAVDLADTLYHRYVLPSGAFIERDRAAWIEPARGWRTIPWGVNFRGNEILDAYQTLKQDLSPEQSAWWREQLQKLGTWIHRNPIVGSLVFNASLDICRLHWRLGKEFGNTEWQRWAMEAAHFRVRKDVDAEGWIQGENGGVSGIYQLVGARFLARFAVEARDPVLEDATRRVFRGAVAFATPSLAWTGNFGTRSAGLSQIPPPLILAAASLGEPEAVHLTKQFGEMSWSSDPALWKAALAHPARPPEYQPIRAFEGITSTVLREGPWVFYLCDYRKSRWARGFVGLWHSDHGDWVFSSLHSLPTKDESVNLKMGIAQTDTSDWGGLPHVRVTGDKAAFDSQQKMERLKVSREKAGVSAEWSEPLLDRDGKVGGTAEFRLSAAGEVLELSLRAKELAGAATVDYHVLHRPTSAAALWAGEEVERIAAGRLPETGGTGNYDGRTFEKNRPGKFAIQIDNSVLGFEVVDSPGDAKVTLGVVADAGLHSSNHGGFRLRFEVPASPREFTLTLRIRKLN